MTDFFWYQYKGNCWALADVAFQTIGLQWLNVVSMDHHSLHCHQQLWCTFFRLALLKVSPKNLKVFPEILHGFLDWKYQIHNFNTKYNNPTPKDPSQIDGRALIGCSNKKLGVFHHLSGEEEISPNPFLVPTCDWQPESMQRVCHLSVELFLIFFFSSGLTLMVLLLLLSHNGARSLACLRILKSKDQLCSSPYKVPPLPSSSVPFLVI